MKTFTQHFLLTFLKRFQKECIRYHLNYSWDAVLSGLPVRLAINLTNYRTTNLKYNKKIPVTGDF